VNLLTDSQCHTHLCKQVMSFRISVTGNNQDSISWHLVINFVGGQGAPQDAGGDPGNHALCNRESHWNQKIIQILSLMMNRNKKFEL